MNIFKIYFIIVFFLSQHKYLSQETLVHFEGTIYNEKNGIIKGASIKITQGELQVNIIKSDENGDYNIYLPLNGDYNITVTALGCVQKKYFVSTMGIPKDKSQIQFATNIADLTLVT